MMPFGLFWSIQILFPRLVFPFVEWRPVVQDDEFALTLSMAI